MRVTELSEIKASPREIFLIWQCPYSFDDDYILVNDLHPKVCKWQEDLRLMHAYDHSRDFTMICLF